MDLQILDRYKTRRLQVGGLSKEELLTQLEQAHILLNDAAKTLFACDLFQTSTILRELNIIEVSVRDLGFRDGAAMPQIQEKAFALGLGIPPLELGPYFRLQYLDQPEGHIGHQATKHQAPPGSLTIASLPLSDDYEVPKGFYLRRIDGILWLRGYKSDLDHRYGPDDHLVFAIDFDQSQSKS